MSSPESRPRLAIIGGGDLGQQIAAVARAHGGFELAGFFDDFQSCGSSTPAGPILGSLSEVGPAHERGDFDVLLIGIGYKHAAFRRQCFERFSATIDFAVIVHPAAHIEPTVTLGAGTVIGAGCVLDNHVTIGENCYFNPGCVLGHDTKVGAHCFFGPGVTLAGFINVGPDCFLGVGTTVIDNVSLAAWTQTGGGTLVCSDLIDPGVYVGNPARRLRDRT